MSFSVCDAEGLTVLGIYARAGNENPEKIGDLWRRFQAMGGASAIAARHDDTVYCVYCEYETDLSGPFTVLVGCSVDADAVIPDQMKKLAIDSGKFAVFEAVGPLPTSVFQTWAEIWNTPLERRYQADFDCYGSDGKVTIHVGVQ